ncbi:MAG: AMP-binding protein [Clostridiales bacterium]|nr:AMP-binding protein [Clostridiales bacterium]
MILYENTKTVYDLISRAEVEYRDKVYLRYEANGVVFDVTYQQFALECKAMMAWYTDSCKKAGRKIKIGLMGSASHQYLVMLLGVMAAGGVVVPLDIQMNVETFADCVNRSDIDLLFYDWKHLALVRGMREQCPNCKGVFSMQHGFHVPCFDNIMSGYIGRSVEPEISEDDLAMILFTSGTTGRGKGVMLSQRNLIDNTFSNTDEYAKNEVYLNILPIHHVFCINGDILPVMRYGATVCLNGEMSQLAAHIQVFQPSAIRMVPMVAKSLYNRIALLSRQDRTRSINEIRSEVLGGHLHRIICGGGYLTPELAANYQRLGISIAQGYGMSECSPVISAVDWKRPDKVASVGKIVDRCEVRIVDGEIQVKSPSVMMGYYKEPDKTAEAITEDGWLCTGDLGYVDDENFLYLTGRKKNLIIMSNGENVAPEEIENLFTDDQLIEEILVFGEDDQITAEIYPNNKYAQAAGIQDIPGVINEIVGRHNDSLPTYKRIMKVRLRDVPFEKTSSKKIIRSQYFTQKKKEEDELAKVKKPETELQTRIYQCVEGVLGHSRFGIDTDLYAAGLDSMGSVLLIGDLHDQMNAEITLAELMENASVEKLEAFIQNSHDKPEVDYTKQDVYPLTGLQTYFAYVMQGNTTANLPFFFKLDPSVELERLSQSIGDLCDVHPELKDIIQKEDGVYKNFRHDEVRVEIPITRMSDADWAKERKTLLKPFLYKDNEPLYHIGIYQTDSANYLYFDVAHIIGDGMTMNVLFEDLNALYMGKEVKKQDYTYYEYILDEKARESTGERQRNIEYFADLMKDFRIKKSILTLKNSYDLKKGHNAAVHKRLSGLNKRDVLAFCKKYGVSENVMFLTAFNYCIGIFSNEDDTISTSIHSGRTDSRWNRLAGPLFLTYFYRYTRIHHETVPQLLKRSGRQIMETMQCHISTLHADEMFFQYQGDILNIDEIGGAPAERQQIQLDSLPFHLMVMSDRQGYYYELRYWENRFDAEQLKIFMICYETIVEAMLEERSVRRLKEHLPITVYPLHYMTTAGRLNAEANHDLIADVGADEPIKVYVFNKDYRKQPFGAWGELFILDHPASGWIDKITNPYGKGILYQTGRTARILPNGNIEILENAGRMVIRESVRGRDFLDLNKLECALLEYGGIKRAEAYVSYSEANQLVLCADVYGDGTIKEEPLQEYIKEELGETLVPAKCNIYKE